MFLYKILPLKFPRISMRALWKGVSSHLLTTSSTSSLVLRHRSLSFSSISFAFPLYSASLRFLSWLHFSFIRLLCSSASWLCLFFNSSILVDRLDISSSFFCSTSCNFPGDRGDWNKNIFKFKFIILNPKKSRHIIIYYYIYLTQLLQSYTCDVYLVLAASYLVMNQRGWNGVGLISRYSNKLFFFFFFFFFFFTILAFLPINSSSSSSSSSRRRSNMLVSCYYTCFRPRWSYWRRRRRSWSCGSRRIW